MNLASASIRSSTRDDKAIFSTLGIAQIDVSIGSRILEKVDSEIALIRARTLQVVREKMPIATLFKPELRIDLDQFVKDQMLIHQIAAFLSFFHGVVDVRMISERFVTTELFLSIKSMFGLDSEPYLAFFYEACCDVINQKTSPSKLISAIEGRIYSLRRALMAQVAPHLIFANQYRCAVPLQAISSIKEEGASFLREVLGFHLSMIRGAHFSSMRNNLSFVCEELIPFVQKITKKFFAENGITCPENPLRFRAGDNRHALVVATIMEACLKALGYKTRLLVRTDLEPRVTLATAHSLIEVVDEDGSKFLVDPCYVQFHMDVSLHDAQLPRYPVLVLEEHEVDAYIEEYMMKPWRGFLEELRRDNTLVRAQLIQQDKIISFELNGTELPITFPPSNREDWVRDAFKRVWGLSTYTRVFSNRGFQEIFNGDTDHHHTYDFIQSMQIAALTKRPCCLDIERKLDELMISHALLAQNSPEALSLIFQLQPAEQIKYAALVDCDPRLNGPAGIDLNLNVYFRSLKKRVNIEGRDLSVVYGCSGADCTSVLLATDACDFTFVDLTKVTYAEFEEALALLKERSFSSEFQIVARLEKDEFILYQSLYAAAVSKPCATGCYMNDLPLKFLFGLREMGVDLDSLVLKTIEEGLIQLHFPWQYDLHSPVRMRHVTFVNTDMTLPSKYPVFLNEKLEAGFDIFYMKASDTAAERYPLFLPEIARAIKTGGWLMTGDKTFKMETNDPEVVLEGSGLTFVSKKTSQTKLFEDLVHPAFEPMFFEFPSLALPRKNRKAGSDSTYWSIVNLRQKIALSSCL